MRGEGCRGCEEVDAGVLGSGVGLSIRRDRLMLRLVVMEDIAQPAHVEPLAASWPLHEVLDLFADRTIGCRSVWLRRSRSSALTKLARRRMRRDRDQVRPATITSMHLDHIGDLAEPIAVDAFAADRTRPQVVDRLAPLRLAVDDEWIIRVSHT